MIPILYAADEKRFVNNGIGFLSEATCCEVTEERNGTYELLLRYPMDGLLYDRLQEGCIIKAKPNETSSPQLFKIYSSGKPMNGIVTYYAEHISYELNGFPVESVIIVSRNAKDALNTILSASVIDHEYKADSDIETLNTAYFELVSVRAALGGVDGSVLDIWGGEYEFDNFSVKLHANRGSDTGIKIAYGKNLTDINQERNISSMYSGVYPYARVFNTAEGSTDVEETIITLSEKIIYSPRADQLARTKILLKDFSEFFGEGETITESSLRTKCKSWVSSSGFDIPTVSITVMFENLWQTPEYEKYALLERVNLCDTVEVEYPKLGVSAKAKVIKTRYDVLREKYIAIELGDAKANLANTINSNTAETSKLSQALNAYSVTLKKTSDSIMSEVKKKVNDTEFGTKITQNYESVRIAWNSVSKYIEFAAGEINIYSSQNQGINDLLMKMNSTGAWYYNSGTTIGSIGTNRWAGDEDFKGLVFDLESDAGFMCWAHKENASDEAFTIKLIYYADDSKAKKGLHFLCDTYCGGNLYLNDAVHTEIYNDGSGGLCSDSSDVFLKGKGCTFLCGDDFTFTNSKNLLIDCYNNIDMHNYSILNQSDARYKTNIEDASTEVLPLLSEIELKEFDWIESGEHCDMGIIAQQLQTILPDLVDTNKTTGRLSIKTDKFIPYLIKAIQELTRYSNVRGEAETSDFASKPKWVDEYTANEKTAFISANLRPAKSDKVKKTKIIIPIAKGVKQNEWQNPTKRTDREC